MLSRESMSLPKDPRLLGDPVQDVQALLEHVGDVKRAVLESFAKLNARNALTIAQAQIFVDQGLQFPAIQVPSTDPNNLDEYKEAPDWLPTFIGSTTAGAQTYSAQIGRATKIGRAVLIEGLIVLATKGGTIAGDVLIGGLPYTGGSTAIFGGIALGSALGITLTAGYTQLGIQVNGANATTLRIRQIGSGLTDIPLPVAGIAAGSAISFAGIYTV